MGYVKNMEKVPLFQKNDIKKALILRVFIDFTGAREGNRTLKVLLPADFESAASTNSATLALVILAFLIKYNIINNKSQIVIL